MRTKGTRSPAATVKVSVGSQVTAEGNDGSIQPDRIRAGDTDKFLTFTADPWDAAAVVKPETQHHLHRDATAKSLHYPDDADWLSPRRHGVDHPHQALRSLPVGRHD